MHSLSIAAECGLGCGSHTTSKLLKVGQVGRETVLDTRLKCQGNDMAGPGPGPLAGLGGPPKAGLLM